MSIIEEVSVWWIGGADAYSRYVVQQQLVRTEAFVAAAQLQYNHLQMVGWLQQGLWSLPSGKRPESLPGR